MTLAATLLSFRYRVLHLCLYLLTLWLLGPGYMDAHNIPGKGAVAGAVFIVDAQGRSYVPGVKVKLQGPKPLQTGTDEKGQYSFGEVDPGKYTIVATFSGMEGEQAITIGPGVVRVELELKPVSVQTSVTVSENSNDTKAPIAIGTITQKTIDDAPNATERFESLLPLVPGVVRGPDGRINMKGARSTQNGALVNSANVTDPATGQAAINLPIDVVSSVQVIGGHSIATSHGRLRRHCA